MIPTDNESIIKIRKEALTCPCIEKISDNKSYIEFFNKFLLANRPCILPSYFTSLWRSRKDWLQEDGSPDFQFLKTDFGETLVPVANCDKREYGSHPKIEMKLAEFISYWQKYRSAGYPTEMDCLYLKDFHFNKAFPTYEAYQTPPYFTSDWMNEFWDRRHIILSEDKLDDYRFVYMGPKGSWTPLHADVFRSFSWSANICGRKKWVFLPPGEEKCLTDINGRLAFDIFSEELKNANKYPNYKNLQHQMEIIQEAGEIIYVPSGWHHQVFNLEDTISINHNWSNGCNIDISWEYIKQGLVAVEHEILEFKDSLMADKEWYRHCQRMLKADKGIDFPEFFIFMKTIAQTRIKALTNPEDKSSDVTSPHCQDINLLRFDLKRVRFVLEDMRSNNEFKAFDEEGGGQIMSDIHRLISEINTVTEMSS